MKRRLVKYFMFVRSLTVIIKLDFIGLIKYGVNVLELYKLCRRSLTEAIRPDNTLAMENKLRKLPITHNHPHEQMGR